MSKPDFKTTADEVFYVEKVLNRRIKKGVVQYFLKWQGYSDSENSWEPISNLNCPDLISKFEQNRKKNNGKEKEKVATMKVQAEAKKLVGFDRGLEPDEIIGVVKDNDEYKFLMKWKGTDEEDLVLAKECNEKCPQNVIKFYEERLIWSSSH